MTVTFTLALAPLLVVDTAKARVPVVAGVSAWKSTSTLSPMATLQELGSVTVNVLIVAPAGGPALKKQVLEWSITWTLLGATESAGAALAVTVIVLPVDSAAVAVKVRAKLGAGVVVVTAVVGLTARPLTAPLTVPIV